LNCRYINIEGESEIETEGETENHPVAQINSVFFLGKLSVLPLGDEAVQKGRSIAVMLSIPSYRTPIRSFFERGAISPTHING